MNAKAPFFFLLFLCIIGSMHLSAQCKLILEYDEAGNRIYRGHGSDGNADLAVTLTFLPTNINGPTTIFFTIQISEIENNCALGEISVIFTKDARLSFTYDQSLINYGPFALDNPKWEYDGTSFPSFHFFKSNVSIGPGQANKFGFEATYDPQQTSGEVSYTITILSGSGGEINFSNNIDSETLFYQSN